MIELSPHKSSYDQFVDDKEENVRNTKLHKILSRFFPIKAPKGTQQEIHYKYDFKGKNKKSVVNDIKGGVIAEEIKLKQTNDIVQVGTIINLEIVDKLLRNKVKKIFLLSFETDEERDKVCKELKKIEKGKKCIDISLLKKDKINIIEFTGYEIKRTNLSEEDCLHNLDSLKNTIKLKLEITEGVRWLYDQSEICCITGTPKEKNRVLGSIPAFTDRMSFIINGLERIPIAQIIPPYGLIIEGKCDSDFVTTYTAWIRPKEGRYLNFTTKDDGRNKGIIKVNIGGVDKAINLNSFLEYFDFRGEADKVFQGINRSADFMADEFISPLNIGGLCNAINADNINLTLKTRDQTIDRLNELLRIPNLYDKFCETKVDIKFSKCLKDIADETNSYRNKSFDKLDDSKQNTIKILNRLLLEEAYPDQIPKRGKKMVISRLYEKNKNVRSRRKTPELSPKDKSFIWQHLFTPDTLYNLSPKGRKRINDKLVKPLRTLNLIQPSPDMTHLTKEDVFGIAYYLFCLVNGIEGYEGDDIDHLANREVLLVGDQLEKVAEKAIYRIRQTIKEDIRGERDLDVSLSKMPAIFNSYIENYSDGEFSQILDQTNPLSEVSHKRKLTFYGPGGISNEYRGLDRRDVHYSHYGRICPVETPESEKIGLTLHLAAYSRVEDGEIKTPYISLNKGSKKISFLEPSEENVPILPYREKNEGGLLFARAGEREMIRLNNANEAMYQDAYPAQMLGLAASLIPFVQHDDANRVLMGAKNLKQALPLLKPEQPIVKTGFEKVIADLCCRGVKASEGGKVSKVNDKEIKIKNDSGEEKVYPLRSQAPTIHETILYNKPCVNPKEGVKQGQVIADGAAMKDGELALGVNLLVAYMPWYGYNFEDGIVISERLVKEDILTSLHVKEIIIDIEEDEVTYSEKKGTILKDFKDLGLMMCLNSDGIIEKDLEVTPGTVLVRKYRSYKEKVKPSEHPIKIKGLNYVNDPFDVCADRNTWGKVIKAEKLYLKGKDRVRIWLTQKRKVTVGDKLMGRHGNKGVISKIVPQEEMPRLKDGTPVDVILNPHGVISRMNLGQLLETHVGLLLRKKGIDSKVVKPFEKYDTENLKNDLENLGFTDGKAGFTDGKAVLIDGKTGNQFNSPVVVGYQYMVKLNHIAEEKLHSRLQGDYTPIIQQPPRGKKRKGGQRLGEMEVWSLLAQKAFILLGELLSVKSDDIKGRVDVFEKLSQHGIAMPGLALSPHLPESFRVFLMLLKCLGIKPRLYMKDNTIISDLDYMPAFEAKDIDGLSLEWASDNDIKEWGKPLSESRYKETKTYGEISCGCKGYFDRILIFRNPLICREHGRDVTITCRCKGNFKDITSQDKKGNFICMQHKNVLIMKGKGKNTTVIQKKGQKNPTVIWEEEKILYNDGGMFSEKIFGKKEDTRRVSMGVIELATEMNHPLSEQKIQFLSVIPPELRPLLADKEGGAELNTLYQRIINQNNRLKELISLKKEGKDIPVSEIDDEKNDLQKRINQLMEDGLERSGRRYRSLTDMLSGKYGIFRQAMLGKRVDVSGRAVIIPAPTLNLDQTELPYEIAVKLFEPWLKNQLVKDHGISKSAAIGIIKRFREIENRAKIRNSIQSLIEENNLVVLLNRAPSLHKYNVLSFKPKISYNSTIGLHPLVCAGFNADFDGDQMAVFIPWIGQQEARERLDPKSNILSSANGSIILHFSQDIIAGLFIAGKGDKKETKKLLMQLYLTENREDFIRNAQELMKEGFDKVTEAGLTFSLFDLDAFNVDVSRRNELFNEIIRGSKPLDQVEKEEKGHIFDEWKSRVKKEINIKLKEALAKNNPVAVMSLSGARGDLDTMTQLAGMRGLMEKPGGGYIEEPVISNFREGLSPLEFFASTHGSRKSLVDKKLKVADAGDFTRRMIHSAFDITVTEEDCGTTNGIIIEDIEPRGKDNKTQIHERIIGRVALKDVAGTNIKAGEVITENILGKSKSLLPPAIKVRSVLTCNSKKGTCKKCYGWELSKKDFPEIGLPVGIIAAQSIGERGTQLSMRTFHTGGVKGEDITQGLPRVKNIFENRKIPLLMYKITKPGSSIFIADEEVDEWNYYCEKRRVEAENGEIPEFKQAMDDQSPKMIKKTINKIWEDNNEDIQSTLHFILREMHGAYKGEIDDKHFELILKTMLKQDKIVGITESAQTNSNFLASASFQGARDILKQAADAGQKISISGLREAIMVGGIFDNKKE